MATYYMRVAANGGNDSNSGTWASPWLTLAHALAASAAGDTIMIDDGSYAYVTDTTIGSRIIKAIHPARAIFDGGGGTSMYWHVHGTVTLDGLKFANIDNTASPAYALLDVDTQPSTILLNRIVVDKTVVLGQAVAAGSGFFGNVSDIGPYTASIFNSSFFDCFSSTSGLTGLLGCQGSGPIAVNIFNCVAVALRIGAHWGAICGGSGAHRQYYFKNFCVANYSPSTFGFKDPFGYADGAVNILGGVWAYNTIQNPTGLAGTSDPLFEDKVNGDFNLQASSPLRGAGVA